MYTKKSPVFQNTVKLFDYEMVGSFLPSLCSLQTLSYTFFFEEEKLHLLIYKVPSGTHKTLHKLSDKMMMTINVQNSILQMKTSAWLWDQETKAIFLLSARNIP